MERAARHDLADGSLVEFDHGLTAVPWGSHLVFNLGVRDGEAQTTHGALVGHRHFRDLVRIRLLGARSGEQANRPQGDGENTESDRPGNHIGQGRC